MKFGFGVGEIRFDLVYLGVRWDVVVYVAYGERDSSVRRSDADDIVLSADL